MGDVFRKGYVIDSSFVLAKLFPDEINSSVEELFDKLKKQKVYLFAPFILSFEVLNGLVAGVLSKRVSVKIANELGKKFLELEIELVDINYLETLELAQKYALSFYDASYLWIAKKNNTSLLTLDKKLAKIASN